MFKHIAKPIHDWDRAHQHAWHTAVTPDNTLAKAAQKDAEPPPKTPMRLRSNANTPTRLALHMQQNGEHIAVLAEGSDMLDILRVSAKEMGAAREFVRGMVMLSR